MSPQRRHLRSPTAAVWIALLSILMTVIAPVISQSLMAQREAPQHAHAGHAVHEHAELSSGHATHDSQRDHGGHQGHEACGYCSLFAHTPVIGEAAQPVLVPGGGSGQPPPPRRLAFLPQTLAYRPQQPRAPPLPLAAISSPSDPSARLAL